MKSGAAQGNSGINGEDAASKGGQYVRIQPCPEYGSLQRIPAFGEQHADFQVLQGDRRQIQIAGFHAATPGSPRHKRMFCTADRSTGACCRNSRATPNFRAGSFTMRASPPFVLKTVCLCFGALIATLDDSRR